MLGYVPRFILAILFYFHLSFCIAASFIDSFSIGAGYGKPDLIYGGRIAIQKDWTISWDFMQDKIQLSGYWDASTAYWRTRNHDFNHDQLFALAIAPIFHLEATQLFNKINPYFEASVGIGYLSEKDFGRREYGSHFTFQDILGIGFVFGKDNQYDLSYRYIHYSNANLFHPNNGLDIKGLILFRYHLT